MDPLGLSPGYRELPPPPALRGVLACLWVRVVGDAGGPPIRVLPDACSDLIWQAGRGAFVAGPDTEPMYSPAQPGLVLVGARFLPGAGGPALAVPLSDLRNLRVDADELRRSLGDRLPGTLTVRAALREVVATASRMAREGPPDLAVRAAARRLTDPASRVETLADDLGLSERQLRRRFHAAVGYGPKTLQRVLRFQRFLTRLDADLTGAASVDLATIAIDTGYADQPHLTRECARLAGVSPAALARYNASIAVPA
jgi:AraC-like DNA-binding protein